MPANAFGMAEFQLVLLRRMADYQPELVEQARARLGADAGAMREANAHWQRMTRSRAFRGGLRTMFGVLGEPDAQQSVRIGASTGTAARWDLPLWPGLRYEAIAGPDGTLVSTMIVRDPPGGRPLPQCISDLTPWSWVLGDVERAFPPVRHRAGSAPSRWTLLFTAPDGRERPVPVAGEFVWGLLQRIGPREA